MLTLASFVFTVRFAYAPFPKRAFLGYSEGADPDLTYMHRKELPITFGSSKTWTDMLVKPTASSFWAIITDAKFETNSDKDWRSLNTLTRMRSWRKMILGAYRWLHVVTISGCSSPRLWECMLLAIFTTWRFAWEWNGMWWNPLMEWFWKGLAVAKPRGSVVTEKLPDYT